MDPKQIVVLGGGFAGLWSAVGAARKLDELGIGSDQVQVTLVNRDAFHGIRVRNYESDLSRIRVPLDDVLEPVGVQRMEGNVTAIDLQHQVVTVQQHADPKFVPYDRLVFAVGSQVVRPPIPGLAEFGFDIDTYGGAHRLERHLKSLPSNASCLGRWTMVVVGAGLTGIELACEMPQRLRAIQSEHRMTEDPRVILVDRNRLVGSDMGDSARPVISEALQSLGVEVRLETEVAAVGSDSVTFSSGEVLPAATLIWCAGMRSNPLTSQFPVEHDPSGRIAVDEFLRVRGLGTVFAAGDVARVMMDASHPSVMSCQHSRPMGRYAGHNVVCDLLSLPMLPLQIDWYVTVLDLGPWGAVYTEGWDRQVVAQGMAAKKTKQVINCERIYPPLTRDREQILKAAEPIVQTPPSYGRR